MNNFSQNMLKTFEECPYKFFLKYEKGISVPQPQGYFEKGKKIHALANYYLRGDDISKLLPTLNETEKIVWDLLFQNEYFQKKYVNSEYNLSCKIGNYWVGGRLDALMCDKDEKNYYILDYKTGKIPQNPECDYQTMIYLLCADKILKDYNFLKFIYIDLVNNKNCVIEFDESKRKSYSEKLLSLCESITECDNFAKSQKCKICEYKKIC